MGWDKPLHTGRAGHRLSYAGNYLTAVQPSVTGFDTKWKVAWGISLIATRLEQQLDTAYDHFCGLGWKADTPGPQIQLWTCACKDNVCAPVIGKTALVVQRNGLHFGQVGWPKVESLAGSAVVDGQPYGIHIVDLVQNLTVGGTQPVYVAHFALESRASNSGNVEAVGITVESNAQNAVGICFFRLWRSPGRSTNGVITPLALSTL